MAELLDNAYFKKIHFKPFKIWIEVGFIFIEEINNQEM